MPEEPLTELVGNPRDIGLAIAHLRCDRTQAALARSCGLPHATWSLYENGRRKPRAGNLAKLLSALGCTQLDLEEVAWRLRRRRLSATAPTRPMLQRTSAPQPPRLGLAGGSLLQPPGAVASSHQAELRRLFAQFSAMLEQLCALLERAIV